MTIQGSNALEASSGGIDDAAFNRIRQIAKDGWGLYMDETKRALIQSRLTRRMRVTSCASFNAYCDLISDPNAAERDEFITAITTNVTSFFREEHHFDTLATELVPKLLTKAKSGKRVRIWSAGCSSGQEPYSIAATVLSAAPEMKALDFKILATDVNPQVLQEAKEATYMLRMDTQISQENGARLFEGWTGAAEGQVTIRSELREKISFGRLNLMDNWPMAGPFDAIFCRNVAIYFDKDTQSKLWRRFSKTLTPGGWLFIGHSERVGEPNDIGLIPQGVTAYRKEE